MKNVLLTGASGFVGQYFINHYVKQYNIETFSFLKDDVSSLDIEGVETIVHLSALVHQMDGASANKYERINVTQTLELAQKAKESGVEHFVFMSTIAVYGVEVGQINENTKCNPLTNYGKTKLKAESELQKLEDDDFRVSIIRPPIVNGYEAPGNMKSLVNLVKKVPILPFGSIDNRRSMIYVGNLAYFMDVIIEKRVSGIFLVADEKSLSTTKLIELIAEALGKRVYLIRVPFFEGLLKLIKPTFHKRLFGSLEVDNQDTIRRLFGKVKTSLPKSGEAEGVLPYSVEDGICLMIDRCLTKDTK